MLYDGFNALPYEDYVSLLAMKEKCRHLIN